MGKTLSFSYCALRKQCKQRFMKTENCEEETRKFQEIDEKNEQQNMSAFKKTSTCQAWQ